MLFPFELIVPKYPNLAYMNVQWKNCSQKCEWEKNLSATQAKVTNGKGRDSSRISDVRYSTCTSWAGALLPAPTSDMPPSLICCKIPPCCVQPLLQPGWGKRQNPKGRKKDSFVIFPFPALWDWALSQISGLWQWSGERTALQATEHKERERMAAIKCGRGWKICLDCII